LSIVKPNAVAKNAIGQICSRFEQAGLNIVAARLRFCRKERPKAFLRRAIAASVFRDLGQIQDLGADHGAGAGGLRTPLRATVS